MSDNINQYDKCFQDLMDIIHEQRALIADLANYIERLKIGGGGSARLADHTFTSNGTYRAIDFNVDGFRTVTVDTSGESGVLPVYETGMEYMRYQTLVDGDSDITYIVTPIEGDSYVSKDVATDVDEGNLKPTSDCRIVIYDHAPTQQELNSLPENVLVVVYNPNDTPYSGIVL